MRENIDRLPLVHTQTGDGSHNLLVYGTELQSPEPPGQGYIHSKVSNRLLGPAYSMNSTTCLQGNVTTRAPVAPVTCPFT